MNIPTRNQILDLKISFLIKRLIKIDFGIKIFYIIKDFLLLINLFDFYLIYHKYSI